MTQPRILVLDIETAPHLALVWGLYKQYVNIDQIIEPGYMLSWSAKWNGERGAKFGGEWQGDGWLEELHQMMTEADAIVHYNGDRFDLPWINGTFEQHGLDPVPEVISIDLLKTVRKLRLASGKLDWVVRVFLGDRKVDTGGFGLWLGVMGYLGPEEQAKAQKRMEKYNRFDVDLTDRVLDRFKHRIKNLPNVGEVWPGGDVSCPRCDSTHVQRRGVSRTRVGEFPRYQCQDCRGWFKGTRREHGHGVVAI